MLRIPIVSRFLSPVESSEAVPPTALEISRKITQLTDVGIGSAAGVASYVDEALVSSICSAVEPLFTLVRGTPSCTHCLRLIVRSLLHRTSPLDLLSAFSVIHNDVNGGHMGLSSLVAIYMLLGYIQTGEFVFKIPKNSGYEVAFSTIKKLLKPWISKGPKGEVVAQACLTTSVFQAFSLLVPNDIQQQEFDKAISAARSISVYLNFLEKVTVFVCTLSKCVVQRLYDWTVSPTSEIIEWLAEVNKLDILYKDETTGAFSTLKKRLARYREDREKLFLLYKKGKAYLRVVDTQDPVKGVFKKVQQATKTVSQIILANTGSFVGNEGKSSPFTIYVFGEPGVGKTILCDHLFRDLFSVLQMDRFDPLVDKYSFNQASPYFDTYNYQRVFEAQDVLQYRDKQVLQNEISALMKMADESACPLNTAECSTKGTVFFASDFMFLTSNKDPCEYIQTLSAVMVEPNAFIRRMDIIVELCRRPSPNFDKSNFVFKMDGLEMEYWQFVLYVAKKAQQKMVTSHETIDVERHFDEGECSVIRDELFYLSGKTISSPVELLRELDLVPAPVAQGKIEPKLRRKRRSKSRTSVVSAILKNETDIVEGPLKDPGAVVAQSSDAMVEGIPIDQLCLAHGLVLPPGPIDVREAATSSFWCALSVANCVEVVFKAKYFEDIVIPCAGALRRVVLRYNAKGWGADSYVETISMPSYLSTLQEWFEEKWKHFKAVLSDSLGTSKGIVWRVLGGVRSLFTSTVESMIWDIWKDRMIRLCSFGLAICKGLAVVVPIFVAAYYTYKKMWMKTNDEKTESDDIIHQGGALFGSGESVMSTSSNRSYLPSQEWFAKHRAAYASRPIVPMAQASDNQLEHVVNACFNNLGKVRCGTTTTHCLGVGHQMILVPQHVLGEMTPGLQVQVVFPSLYSVTFQLSEARVELFESNHLALLDLKRLPALKTVRSFSGLVQHFVPEGSRAELDVGVLPVLRLVDGLYQRERLQLLDVDHGERQQALKGVSKQYNVDFMLSYSCVTREGDCGAPILSLVGGVWRIVGVHIGFRSPGRGYGTYTCRGWLNEFVNQPVLPEAQGVESLEPTAVQPSPINFLGELSHNLVHLPNSTKLRRSPLAVRRPITGPAALKGALYGADGKSTPLALSLKKWDVPSRVQNPDQYRLAAHELMGYYTSPVKRKVYSVEESVFGSEDDVWFDAIDHDASVGYPWCATVTRRDLVDWENKTVSKELTDSCTTFLSRLNNGVVDPFVLLDIPKDERLPLAKVESGKVRLINVFPIHVNLVARMLYGQFHSVVISRSHNTPIKLGLSPKLSDVRALVSWLRIGEEGREYLCGDISSSDRSLPYELLATCHEKIVEWYNDEYAEARRNLFRAAFCPTHVAGRWIYSVNQGLPSGYYLTALLNSMSYAVLLSTWAHSVDSDCSIAVYGDDHVVSLPSGKTDHVELVEWFARRGLTYTGTDKEALVGLCDWTGIEFLKRRFQKRGGLWFFHLSADAIIESVGWYRQTKDTKRMSQRELAAMLMQNALVELCQCEQQDWYLFMCECEPVLKRFNLVFERDDYLRMYVEGTDEFVSQVLATGSNIAHLGDCCVCEEVYQELVVTQGDEVQALGEDQPMKSEVAITNIGLVSPTDKEIGLVKFHETVPQETMTFPFVDCPVIDGHFPWPKEYCRTLERTYKLRDLPLTHESGLVFPLIRISTSELFVQDYIRTKLAFATFVRYDVEFTVRIVSTKFHYGSLMCLFRPNLFNGYFPPSNDDLRGSQYDCVLTASQCAHQVLSISGGTSSSYIQPWTLPRQYVRVHQAADDQYCLGAFDVYALTAALPAMADKARILIFASLKNVSLYGYNSTPNTPVPAQKGYTATGDKIDFDVKFTITGGAWTVPDPGPPTKKTAVKDIPQNTWVPHPMKPGLLRKVFKKTPRKEGGGYDIVYRNADGSLESEWVPDGEVLTQGNESREVKQKEGTWTRVGQKVGLIVDSVISLVTPFRSILDFFGFSNPKGPVEGVATNYLPIVNSVGVSPIPTLAYDSSSILSPIPTDDKDVLISSIASRKTLIWSGLFEGMAGDKVFSLGPHMSFWPKGGNMAGFDGGFFLTPAGMISSRFLFWRSDVLVEIGFYSSVFVTTRFQVSIEYSDPSKEFSTTVSSWCLDVTGDVRKTFTMPFLWDGPFAPTDAVVWKLSVRNITSVVSAEVSESRPVAVTIFVSFPGLQVAMPSWDLNAGTWIIPATYAGALMITPPGVPSAQGEEDPPLRNSETSQAVNYTMNDIPTSLYHLIKRPNYWRSVFQFGQSMVPMSMTTVMRVDAKDPKKQHVAVVQNPMAYFGSMFCFYRGGCRIASGTPEVGGETTPGYDWETKSGGLLRSCIGYLSSAVGRSMHCVEVPYRGPFPFLACPTPVRNKWGYDAAEVLISPESNWDRQAGVLMWGNYLTSLYAADDFQYFIFRGVPVQVAITYNAINEALSKG